MLAALLLSLAVPLCGPTVATAGLVPRADFDETFKLIIASKECGGMLVTAHDERVDSNDQGSGMTTTGRADFRHSDGSQVAVSYKGVDYCIVAEVPFTTVPAEPRRVDVSTGVNLGETARRIEVSHAV